MDIQGIIIATFTPGTAIISKGIATWSTNSLLAATWSGLSFYRKPRR